MKISIYVIIMATAMTCSILAKASCGEPSETEKLMKFVNRLTTCADLYRSEKDSYCENMNNTASPWIINCATAYDKGLMRFFADCRTRLGNDIPDACMVEKSKFYKFQACVTTGVTRRLSEIHSEF